MTLPETLHLVWQQVMVDSRPEVEIEGRRYRVQKTRAQGLRLVEFLYGDTRLTAIEQNTKTASRWAELARSGQRILQFSCRGRYFANISEGKLTRYGAWQSLGLPE